MRRRQRFVDITLTRALHRHAHDRPGLHVDGVLGLVGQVRAAVLHLRDTRVGIVRVTPVLVAAFLGAFPIEAGQVRARRRLDPRRLREPRQKVLIRLPRVAPHDAPQGGVGLERRRIDPYRLAFDQIRGRGVPNVYLRTSLDPAHLLATLPRIVAKFDPRRGAMLFGLEGHDPVVLAAAAAPLALVTLSAAGLPAHRAARIDPMRALRHE